MYICSDSSTYIWSKVCVRLIVLFLETEWMNVGGDLIVSTGDKIVITAVRNAAPATAQGLLMIDDVKVKIILLNFPFPSPHPPPSV